jgi:hypothetical protein
MIGLSILMAGAFLLLIAFVGACLLVVADSKWGPRL